MSALSSSSSSRPFPTPFESNDPQVAMQLYGALTPAISRIRYSVPADERALRRTLYTTTFHRVTYDNTVDAGLQHAGRLLPYPTKVRTPYDAGYLRQIMTPTVDLYSVQDHMSALAPPIRVIDPVNANMSYNLYNARGFNTLRAVRTGKAI